MLSFKRWANKTFTHERDAIGDFGYRTVLHIPIGFLIGVTFPLSYPLLILFIKFERNEDLHTEDQAWKDYNGALIGTALGLLTEVGLLIKLF